MERYRFGVVRFTLRVAKGLKKDSLFHSEQRFLPFASLRVGMTSEGSIFIC